MQLNKGLVALSEAVPTVLKKYPDWNFRFIGSDEGSHIQGKSMKNLMLDQLYYFKSKIEFVDWIDYKEMPYYYEQSDIVVIPSLFESFSYVCAEAMSAAKPVVGSNTTAMNELLGKNRYGLLINPYKPKQIARSIIKLIEKPELRTKLGKKSRKRILDKFNATKIGESVDKIYTQCLEKSRIQLKK